MKLEHTFTVPVPVDEAFKVMLDIERIAPCMPGATVGEHTGEEFTGAVKVKVGPITMQYQGAGKFVDVDEEKHTATIEASGRETRGGGTAKATIRATLAERGERETQVNVVTELAITGKAAQFGRGVMDDVGAKLLGKFADCLSSELAGRPEPEPAVAEPEPVVAEPEPVVAEPEPVVAESVTEPMSDEVTAPAPETVQPSQPAAQRPASVSEPAPKPATTTAPRTRPTEDTIDLLDIAGAPLAKRLVPLVTALLFAAAVIVWQARRARV